MRKQIAFVLAYLELNLSAAMEYRVAFISQTVGMVLNDGMMLVFWWMFFQRFPLVGGWKLTDVVRLWAIVAVSFGLGSGVFGNCMRLAPMIARGQLDYYLTLPKDALLHTLVSRMSTSAWGDVLFGVIAFLAAGSLTPVRVALFVMLALMSCAIFVAFNVIVGSIAFWFGNAETLSSQATSAIVSFATFPGGIFQGWVKVLTFTLIPAAMLGHVPVDQLRNPSPLPVLGVAAFAAGIVLLAVTVFRLGLRQYQSGNLVQLQG